MQRAILEYSHLREVSGRGGSLKITVFPNPIVVSIRTLLRSFQSCPWMHSMSSILDPRSSIQDL